MRDLLKESDPMKSLKSLYWKNFRNLTVENFNMKETPVACMLCLNKGIVSVHSAYRGTPKIIQHISSKHVDQYHEIEPKESFDSRQYHVKNTRC